MSVKLALTVVMKTHIAIILKVATVAHAHPDTLEMAPHAMVCEE